MPTPLAVERAKALVSPVAGAGNGVHVLYDEPVSWVLCDFPRPPRECDARHQSLRQDGAAPDYPEPEVFGTGIAGRMVMTPTSLTLEADEGGTALRIAPEMMRRAIFYRDALELEATGVGTITVRVCGIDRIDAIFHAYFWPRALPLRG